MSTILTALGIVCLIGWAYQDGIRAGTRSTWHRARQAIRRRRRDRGRR